MPAQTGRTVKKYEKFQIGDATGVLRDLNIQSISGIGVEYEDVDLSAINDPAKGSLPGAASVKISIKAVFDTSPAVAASGSGAAPAFSGTHTVLSALNGGMTPRTLAFYIGERQPWVVGEPVFGLANSATSGFLCRNYQVEGETITADFILFPGSALPAWGTAALA